MRPHFWGLVGLLFPLLLLGCQSTPTAIPVAVISPTVTLTATFTATATPTATTTATASPIPTLTTTPTPIPQYTPTAIPRFTPRPWPLHTLTPSPTVPPSPTATATLAPYDVSNIPECIAPIATRGPYEDAWEGCQNFVFSPSNTWVTFQWGPQNCARNAFVINTKTGETLNYGSSWILFLSDERILIRTSYCEAGVATLYNLTTRETLRLGELGRNLWNEQQTILVNQVEGWIINDSLWAYNFETNRFVISPNQEGSRTLTNHFQWLDDQQYGIYQKLVITDGVYGPRSVLLANMESGINTVLLADPNYTYHLDHWSWEGDWVLVIRYPYEPMTLELDPIFDLVNYDCPLGGGNCPEHLEREEYALNWRTGEFILWTEFQER